SALLDDVTQWCPDHRRLDEPGRTNHADLNGAAEQRGPHVRAAFETYELSVECVFFEKSFVVGNHLREFFRDRHVTDAHIGLRGSWVCSCNAQQRGKCQVYSK